MARTFRDRLTARHMLPVYAVTVVVLTAAGCGGTETKSEAKPSGAAPSTSSPTTGSPAAGPDAVAKAQILAVLTHMSDEQAKAYQLGYTSKTHYADYVADPALGKTNTELFQYRQQNVLFKGRPTSTFTVTSVDLTSTPHKATAESCFDMHGWQPVAADTGEPLEGTKGQPLRYTVTDTVQVVGSGTSARWKLTDYTVDKAKPC